MAKIGIGQFRAHPPSTRQLRPRKVGLVQVAAGEIGALQVRAGKQRLPQHGACKVHTGPLCLAENRIRCHCLPEPGAVEGRPLEIALRQAGSGEIRSTQIDRCEQTAREFQAGK